MSAIITVLMPVYNASQFLREALDSILNQTFREFEFLIIDDGSSDDSVAIIRSYEDERIRLLVNETNLGITETLNRGIRESRCELIARMDADDISYPDRLQKQYLYMAVHPECGLLSTWARVITPDKFPVALEKRRASYYYYNLNFECWIYHPTVMFRKEVVISCGMYAREYSEDYDLFWKIAQRFPIHTLEESLVDYRLSPTSLNTVLKKEEYESANQENVLRNIRYFMGPDFTLRNEYLECMRHNFAPILSLNDIKPVLECLLLLDKITAAILQKPNVNRDSEQIRWAAFHKKDFIIEQLFLQLTGVKKLLFVFKCRKPGLLTRKIRKSIHWRFNSVKRRLLSTNKQ